MKKIKEIELSKFQSDSKDPYTIYFVYPKDGRPCIVKGMASEVHQYVYDTFPVALYRYTYWDQGKSRGAWRFTNKGYYIDEKNGRFIFTRYKDNRVITQLSFRRIPHKWISGFEQENIFY